MMSFISYTSIKIKKKEEEEKELEKGGEEEVEEMRKRVREKVCPSRNTKNNQTTMVRAHV